jgi:hypothetical protein
MFEARVINLCNHDIATNFGAIIGEVILVDSCACTVILFAVIIIFFKKKEIEFLLAAVPFKTDFLVELGVGLFFSEGK